MSAKSNNFDLIRLVAALQVAVLHVENHLGVHSHVIDVITRYFPGVPIFFFVSGFLITRSFDRNPKISDFALNRILRIYPALLVCFFVSLGAVWMLDYFRALTVSWAALVAWTAAQLSFVQFYNPDFMRRFGVGVLNGSVWTISVELQFYLLTPLICKVLWPRRKLPHVVDWRIILLMLAFLGANVIFNTAGPHFRDVAFYKTVGVSFVPWIYMFLSGAFVQRNIDFFGEKLSGRFAPVLIVYVICALLGERFLGFGFGNSIHPVMFFGLATVIIAGAFSRPAFSDWLLRRNDLSYGIYLYHMPIVNCALASGLAASPMAVVFGMCATILLGALSWFLVERPALKLKRHPRYVHSDAVQTT